jgi:hypothetical protein
MGFLIELDKLIEKHFGKKEEPVSRQKTPIYSMSGSDPVGFYTQSVHSQPISFPGGTDMKGYLLSPDDETDAKEVKEGHIPWLQGASFGLEGGHPAGNIVGILFDSMKDFHCLLGKKKRFVLKSANPEGKIVIFYDGIIHFRNHLDWRVGVDDIVCEVTLTFDQISQEYDLE